MSYLPLRGMRVLDLGRLKPPALTTVKLAALGADVVKVEEPRRGDYMRTFPPKVGALSADHATQLEVAATLGVSDSLVSDYRRRIEQELRALSFKEVEEARMFELALRERVRTLVEVSDEEAIAV